MDWNAGQYMKFEDERTRPAVDLINRIGISPKSILDVGCGPGNSTARLRARFPDAALLGIDASDNMLSRARKEHPELNFLKCTLPDDYDKLACFDLIFSNACLHWIPGHERLLPMLLKKVNPGGVLAVQMPLVQKALFYKLLDKQLSREKWRTLAKVNNFHNLPPEKTYDILSRISDVSMWEAVYYHTVPAHSAVIDWYRGSGLRPYLEALDPERRGEFLEELLFLIKENYPIQADGSVILKMKRLFFVAAAK